MKCFWIFFHDWSIWEDVILIKTKYGGGYEYESLKYEVEVSGQKRYCKKCGKKEIRET